MGREGGVILMSSQPDQPQPPSVERPIYILLSVSRTTEGEIETDRLEVEISGMGLYEAVSWCDIGKRACLDALTPESLRVTLDSEVMFETSETDEQEETDTDED